MPAVPVEGGLLGAMPEFPIQLSKVQAPPVREDTLARERLLDWLAAKIHDRVVLVIAEAGYGKTTLLADFTRRTRLRTLWFRLDRGDRDWVGFIAHLAAAVRVHVPDFGAATSALLRESATVPPMLDAVLDTFVRELGQLPTDATVLILDDFHLVDDSDQIRHVTRELLTRAPERLTFVFASRRVPPVPLARLRALREVAELGTDDLRFDEAETDRLFREAYEMPLEHGLVTELSKRTEGWAASLQLVRAALHDRDAVQARAFIGSLSGSEGHLYDYLAEEVIGDLPADLQDFLMRTSILDTIDLELGPIAAGVSKEVARQFLLDGERIGLFSRRGIQGKPLARPHPLVRDFLRARLSRVVDVAELAAIHRRVAIQAEGLDWTAAAQHYHLAGDDVAAQRVIASSINRILATGTYASAHAVVQSLSSATLLGAAGFILASRVAILQANPNLSLELAQQALREDPSSPAATLTLMSARSYAGDVAGAISDGRRLESSSDDRVSLLARAFRKTLEASLDGSVTEGIRAFDDLMPHLVEGVDDHYIGVMWLNKAILEFAAGMAPRVLESSNKAIDHLARSSAGIELISARLMRALVLAQLGRMAESRAEAEVARADAPPGQRLETLFETAAIETHFGSEQVAGSLLDRAALLIDPTTDIGEQALLAKAQLHLRRGDYKSAERDLAGVRPGQVRTAAAFEIQRLIAAGTARLLAGDQAQAQELLSAASHLGDHQQAHLWARVAHLSLAMADATADPIQAIAETQGDPGVLSIACEPVLTRLTSVDEVGLQTVAEEAASRPERWIDSLRRVVDRHEVAGVAAARLLARVGTKADVGRLRAFARSTHTSDGLSRTLARRVASGAFIEDLGRVRIRVGERLVEGSSVRRKVLALLCLLISRDKFSATRDDVLDSLWPDLDPSSALNSLNQTVYFLRRLFEPDFREDESAGYLRQDAETVWLDPELVDTQSRRCMALIRATPSVGGSSEVLELANAYSARFALDFAYEGWAEAYRDALHVSYLRAIEQGIRSDMATSQFARAIEIAERAAAVEPESEEIQIALVRLYRLAGAFAAAAEQYGRYSATLRGLGVDPPEFDAVVAGSGSIGTPAY